MTNLPSWELFSHEADMGVRGIGKTLAEAFAMGAKALTGVVTDPQKVEAKIFVDISCSAPDVELLFADWLNAIIYEMETRNMLFAEFAVLIDGENLTAKIGGEKVDQAKHQPAVVVKGATFTELKVIKEDGIWIAQCVVDV